MAVDAVEGDGTAIYAHKAPFYFKTAETDILGNDFFPALFIPQCDSQKIAKGCFAAPGLNLRYPACKDNYIPLPLSFFCTGKYHLSIIFQFQIRLIAAAVLALHCQLCLQPPIPAILRKICLHKDVLQMDRRHTVHKDGTEDPRKPEEILILNPAGAAPFVYPNLQPVDAPVQHPGQLILRGSKTILPITHKPLVAPHIKGSLHALKRHKNPIL